MISGLWANTNLDDGKQTRTRALAEIDESYQQTLIAIYNEVNNEPEEDILKTHPLFTAMKLYDEEEIVHDRTTTTE